MALASTAMTRTESSAVEWSGWRLVSDAAALALHARRCMLDSLLKLRIYIALPLVDPCLFIRLCMFGR